MSKLVLEKEEELEIKLPTFAGLWKKQGNFRKISISVSSTTLKPLTLHHNKLWKALKEMGIPNHLTCLLRNMYVGQEATVETLSGTTDWLRMERVPQGCLLSRCLFNLYTEHIVRNAGLDELQAGIKIGGRNFNNSHRRKRRGT